VVSSFEPVVGFDPNQEVVAEAVYFLFWVKYLADYCHRGCKLVVNAHDQHIFGVNLITDLSVHPQKIGVDGGID